MLEAVNVKRLIAGDECMVYSFALADREITVVCRLSEKSKGIRLRHTRQAQRNPQPSSPKSRFFLGNSVAIPAKVRLALVTIA
jgi:hypothetical protein